MNISELAYELYKQDWIDSNTTKEMRLNAVKEYYEYIQDCIKENEDIDTFEEFLDECGYGEGSLYVCYDEFCDMEYHDKEYMCELLKDDHLIQQYYADIENDYEID